MHYANLKQERFAWRVAAIFSPAGFGADCLQKNLFPNLLTYVSRDAADDTGKIF